MQLLCFMVGGFQLLVLLTRYGLLVICHMLLCPTNPYTIYWYIPTPPKFQQISTCSIIYLLKSLAKHGIVQAVYCASPHRLQREQVLAVTVTQLPHSQQAETVMVEFNTSQWQIQFSRKNNPVKAASKDHP